MSTIVAGLGSVMTYLLVFCYIALGVFIVGVEIRRIRRGEPFNALTLFNGAYALFFVFVPLNVLLLGEAAVRQKYAYQTWSHGDTTTAFALIAAYIAFLLGYLRRKSIARPSKSLEAMDVLRIVQWLIGWYVILGLVALVYHVSLVGGVSDALRYAPRVRTGEFALNGGFLFVRQFAYFLATAFLLAFAMFLDSSAKPMRTRFLVSAAVLGLVFVYYALTTYGRREFLYPMGISFILWWAVGPRRSPIGFWLLVSLSIIWFVTYSILIPVAAQPVAAQAVAAQAVGDFLRDAYIRTVQGLGDSFMHFIAAQHARLWQFGFLTDLWEIPAQFLPSQVLGFERPRGMFGATSEFILGRPLTPGLSGEEPLGLHGYLLVNFSYLGMFLLFYLMGIGYRALDTALRPAKGSSALSWLVFLWVIIGALEFLRDGVLILVLKPRFSWWLAVGILLWFGYRRSARTNTSFQQLSRQTNNP